MTDNTAPQARKLNMDEKRKLEKVMFTDIDTAITKFDSERKALRETSAKTALSNAPAVARTLFAAYIAAKKKSEQSKSALRALGYDIKNEWQNQYRDELVLCYAMPPKALREFDTETERVKAILADLKRSYTLKLFAGGEEAKELFASLARELAAILKQS